MLSIFFYTETGVMTKATKKLVSAPFERSLILKMIFNREFLTYQFTFYTYMYEICSN